MSDTGNAADALMALATSGEGRKKIARLRELLPQIEAAVEAGVTQAKIIEVLNQQGLDITQNTYSVMLSRLRKQRDKKVESGKPVGVVKQMLGKAGDVKGGDVKPPSPNLEKPGEPKTLAWDVEKNGKTNHWE